MHFFLVERAYTQQGHAHSRRLRPSEAARPALMSRAAHALGAPSDGDCVSTFGSVSNCAPAAADNASLWTGDTMAEIGAEGAQFNPMTGAINFFSAGWWY